MGIDKPPGPVAETYEQLGDLCGDAGKSHEPYRKRLRKEVAGACAR